MKNEAILLEAVSLADEILDKGPSEGRGFRIAGLVLRLNEAMGRGEIPMSWCQSVPPSDVLKSLPPPPKLPTFPEQRKMLASIPEEDELDAAWDKLWTSPFTP